MRRRLAVAIASVAAAAIALFALPLAVVLQRSYREEDLLRLQRDAVAATRSLDVGSGGDRVELPRIRARVTVYDGGGRRVAGAGPPRADALVTSALRDGRPTEAAQGSRLIVAVPLLAGERISGVLRAERSAGGAARDTYAAWALIGGIAAVVLALAIAAAALLGRRLARPLEALATAARRLGEGDFSVRAPRARIAEADAIAAALDATAARLDDLINRERAFSADASHQLRTPLAALRIELEALELRGERSAELTAALAQVDRLGGTVDTLLAVARDAPRRDARADLHALVAEAELRWRGPLAAAGRPLRTFADPAHPAAAASPRVVAEILDVLLGNAQDHGAGAVTVRVSEAGESLRIDVSDEGPGIAGDEEELFERRADGAGAGHGIGLSLARSLAHAEGGRLVLTRAAPPVFTVWLTADRPGA